MRPHCYLKADKQMSLFYAFLLFRPSHNNGTRLTLAPFSYVCCAVTVIFLSNNNSSSSSTTSKQLSNLQASKKCIFLIARQLYCFCGTAKTLIQRHLECKYYHIYALKNQLSQFLSLVVSCLLVNFFFLVFS
jgi:hypothetical protein